MSVTIVPDAIFAREEHMS